MSASERPTTWLTPREAEVLRLYATGLTSEEVAIELGEPADAVRAYLEVAMAKLGVGTKLEAIVAADRSGQLGLPADSIPING
jgi:DNA-binding CsgD family transcriptional regulator